MKPIQTLFTLPRPLACAVAILVGLASEPGRAAPAQVVTPHRAVVAPISPFLSHENASDCFSNLFTYVTSPAWSKPGDRISVFDGLALKPVVTLEVPTDLPVDTAVGRVRRLARELAALRTWLLSDRPHAPEWAGAVDEPGFIRLAAAQLRASPRQPLAVLVLGSPFYTGAAGTLSAFAMSDGYVPSDGTLLVAPGQTPFAQMGKDGLMGISVYWAYLDERFSHEQHRMACGRFWALFFQTQGGTLASFAAAPGIALERLRLGVAEPCLAVSLDPADARVVAMRKVIVERAPDAQQTNAVESAVQKPPAASSPVLPQPRGNPAPKLSASPAPPTTVAVASSPAGSNTLNALTDVLPATPSGKIGIGCVWVSPGSPRPNEADVDEYVTTPEGEVLCYKHTDATSGRYFRDVRSAGSSLDPAENWQSAWEYTELRDLNNAEAAKLKFSLNLFRGSGGPIQGFVQVSCGTRHATQPFTFSTPVGNEGLDPDQRPSPFWIDIDIQALLDRLAAAD